MPNFLAASSILFFKFTDMLRFFCVSAAAVVLDIAVSVSGSREVFFSSDIPLAFRQEVSYTIALSQ